MGSACMDDSPLGRIGWLEGRLFHAGRRIVDSRMHTMGWSQERVVATLGDLTGDAVGASERTFPRAEVGSERTLQR